MSATSATEEEQIGRRAVDSLTPLGMVATVKSGYAFKSKDWVDEGVPVVKIQNVRSGRVNLEGCAYVTEQVAAEAEKFRLVSGDVLITMSGEIGAIGVVRGDEHMLLNQRVGRFAIIDPARLDARFLFYLLSNPLLKLEMESIAYGAAQPNISPKLIEGLDVYLPGLRNQQRAAEILWAYDELIENNARRIEILEEMAQAIFREWFVEFRYPGHEGVSLVDSELGPIPEGWAARSLQDVIELAYGKALKSGDRRGGPVPVFGSGGVVGSHDVPLVNGPGIVVGRKGNVGSVHWSDDSFFPIDTTFYVKTDLPMAYAYYMLCDAEFIDSHAAVPGLSREQAYGLSCLVPDRRVVEKFAVVVGQIFAFRKVLEESNRNLRETRDLLLPRLISGEIDVSGLDIELADLSV